MSVSSIGFERWANEVRDPATSNHEPLFRHGTKPLNYAHLDIAHIPTGWTWRGAFSLADGACGASPWAVPVPDRATAENQAFTYLRREAEGRHYPDPENHRWDELLEALPAENQDSLL